MTNQMNSKLTEIRSEYGENLQGITVKVRPDGVAYIDTITTKDGQVIRPEMMRI